MKKAHRRVFLFVLALLQWGFEAHAFGPPSVELNNQGIKNYQDEDYGQAFSHFADALARDSMNPQFHLNLGDTFYKGGEPAKALSEFEAVEAMPKATKEQKFRGMFNAGNVALEMKNIPKALAYYQKALDYKPDSVEAKTNIELALKEEQQQGGGGDKDDQNQKNKDDNSKDKSGDKKDNKQNQSEPKPDQNKNKAQAPTPRPTPHSFKSESLSENDVRRILEELKRQEEEIRARQYKDMNNKNVPERQIEKDW